MKKIALAVLLWIALAASVALAASHELDDAWAAFQKGDYATALQVLRPLAQQGQPEAQHGLGVMYEFGDGVEPNKAEAAKWYRVAADAGLAIAQFSYGNMLLAGEGVDQNDVEAIKWFRLAADQGLANAQHNLAFMLSHGRGAPKDDAESFFWYRRAAEGGLVESQAELGLILIEGQTAPKDEAEGISWYLLAADQGLSGAQYEVATAYRDGRGVPYNPMLSYMWFTIMAGGMTPGDRRDQVLTVRDGVKAHLTPAEIADAESRAEKWIPKKCQQYLLNQSRDSIPVRESVVEISNIGQKPLLVRPAEQTISAGKTILWLGDADTPTEIGLTQPNDETTVRLCVGLPRPAPASTE